MNITKTVSVAVLKVPFPEPYPPPAIALDGISYSDPRPSVLQFFFHTTQPNHGLSAIILDHSEGMCDLQM